ncbi:putative VRR-NUC domain-containing protein [Cronobacter phage JC01]|uniref:Putative VRR-NUC domain-containing protein n=1 Tax=Cronobacter phage JC01 TaxID=2729575 RepID=A0A6M3YQV4_9CAUD|nr:endonuclease [Cronobacter phage JC01]QJI52227.1 putative VRR-NUC domain-containing protein [Cronobacter phage JC01]
MAAKVVKESKVEKEIRQYALATGWWVAKFVAPGKRGVPDRLFIKNGWHLFMEIKRPGEVPTEQQLLRHQEMRKYGAIVVWVDSVEEAKSWLDFIC